MHTFSNLIFVGQDLGFERDLISLSYQTFLIARSRSEPRVLALFCGTCALKADESSFGHFELPQVAIHDSIVVLNFKFGN